MLILSLKFLTAKAVALVMMAAVALWFAMDRKQPALLPPPPGMV
ncbi:MAG TPA: hypothetical protein VFQ52_08480 [Rhizomicrobium sp.]|nr:hypothetical protein [Rhizomicrobium sp.]